MGRVAVLRALDRGRADWCSCATAPSPHGRAPAWWRCWAR